MHAKRGGEARGIPLSCIYKWVTLTYYSIVVKLINVSHNKLSGHQAEGGRQAKLYNNYFYCSIREHHKINTVSRMNSKGYYYTEAGFPSLKTQQVR